jgi:pheromone alpha factor receptor
MSSFDPFEQNITMITGQGAVLDIPMPDVDDYVQEGLTACIDYGSQLGASIVTTVLLFLLTRAKKRRSPVFCLNTIALLLNIIRLACQILFYTSAWFETYAFFSGDMSRVTKGDYATSILAALMTGLVELVMEVSLVVQTMVVSTNMATVYKTTLLASSSLIAAATIGFRMAEMIFNIIAIVEERTPAPYIWLQQADTILITISICFFSAVFMAKLGYTIYRRKQLGVHQFGPMQVIFIMSCQTMILPGECLSAN